MKKLSNKKLVLISILLCFFAIVVSTTMGSSDITVYQTIKILINKIFGVDLGLDDIKNSYINIIWVVRLPRVILAFLVGGALAICGVSYQGIFKNPMADPFILGVSSGAALGASIGIVTKFKFSVLGISPISLLAFVGAIITIIVVYNISRVGSKVPVTTLLLSGIAIGQLLSALISLLMIFTDDMQRIIYWTMGSFNARSWEHVYVTLPYVLIGLLILSLSSRELDIMLLGEDTASQLGVDTEKLKKKVLFTTATITAVAVSVTGIIGFVGLIIPHVVRSFVGPKHKSLIPFSFLIGGVFMIFCDTISRTLISQEIPVGIITALFGGPFFIYLLRKRKTGGF